jgi:hypothetical protein
VECLNPRQRGLGQVSKDTEILKLKTAMSSLASAVASLANAVAVGRDDPEFSGHVKECVKEIRTFVTRLEVDEQSDG